MLKENGVPEALHADLFEIDMPGVLVNKQFVKDESQKALKELIYKFEKRASVN